MLLWECFKPKGGMFQTFDPYVSNIEGLGFKPKFRMTSYKIGIFPYNVILFHHYYHRITEKQTEEAP